MDVGNFLELERAFHGDREHLAAAEIEHVRRFAERLGDALDLGLGGKGGTHRGRQANQGVHQFLFGRGVDLATGDTGGDDQTCKRRQLRRQRLG